MSVRTKMAAGLGKQYNYTNASMQQHSFILLGADEKFLPSRVLVAEVRSGKWRGGLLIQSWVHQSLAGGLAM